MNYAKRAKRVDVRKLKDNIWKNLDIVVPQPTDDADAMVWFLKLQHDWELMVDSSQDVDDRQPTDPTEARVFEDVISGLKKSYPREKLEDISTSFCFICLLHLANERGLKLETNAQDAPNSDAPSDSKVGNIWDVKVCPICFFL